MGDELLITSPSQTAGVTNEDVESENSTNEVNIYNEKASYTNDTFNIKGTADEFFGGFSNPVFYDFITLLSIIVITIFFLKLFVVFFPSKK